MLTILISAYNAAATISQCLESISRSIENFSDGNNVKVFLAIDGCHKTKKTAEKLLTTYSSFLTVYFSNTNNGKYITINTLLSKITVQNTLILFFDADDVMTPDFLKRYYYCYANRINELDSHTPQNIIIKTMCIGVLDEHLVKSYSIMQKSCGKIFEKGIALLRDKKIDDAIPYFIALSLLRANNFFSRFVNYLVRFQIALGDQRYDQPYGFKRRSPHGVFFATFEVCEKLGYFHPHRVGQDSDFLNRARLMGINIVLDKSLPVFVRRISNNSLTNAEETSRNSKYRISVTENNAQLINSGVLVASKQCIYVQDIASSSI